MEIKQCPVCGATLYATWQETRAGVSVEVSSNRLFIVSMGSLDGTSEEEFFCDNGHGSEHMLDALGVDP